MGFGIDYPAFGSVNPLTTTLANTPYAAIDTFNAALENNGATQLLGSLYQAPLVPTGSVTNGGGLNSYLKYVRYNPTTSQTIQAGPALVYWKDETFTTVTPLAAEAFAGATSAANSIAGWLLYNTTTLSTATAAQINGNFCWIAVGGFVPGAFTGSAALANASIMGGLNAAGAWVTVSPATAGNKVAAYALTASVTAAFLADIYIPFIN
jgi:hypothetical protein